MAEWGSRLLPGASRYDLVKKRVLHSSSRGQKRMPKGQSLDGLFLRRVEDGFEVPRVKWLIPTHLSSAGRR